LETNDIQVNGVVVVAFVVNTVAHMVLVFIWN